MINTLCCERNGKWENNNTSIHYDGEPKCWGQIGLTIKRFIIIIRN